MEIKVGSLEHRILDTGIRLAVEGQATFYGYGIALEVAGSNNRGALVAHGTLYKALRRLENAGFVTSQMEDVSNAAGAGRRPRRLYEVTAKGAAALAKPSKARRYAFLPSSSS